MQNLWRNDRNLMAEDYERQQYYYVVESNDLITRARHDLSSNQLKIIDFLISKIKPDFLYFKDVETSMYELCKVLEIKQSGRTYNQLTTTINDLRKKDVVIYNPDLQEVIQTGWISSATYSKNGKVRLRFDDNLKPYLLQLSKNYTQYLLVDTVKLKSKYSILIYKLMRESDKKNGKTPILKSTPEELKEILGAPISYSFNSLKSQILLKAIEEINLKIDDMNLELIQGKYGRKVVQVEIHNVFDPEKYYKDKDLPKINLHNWLEGD